MSPTRGTPTRPIRIDLDLWAEFGAATTALGTDRSEWLRGAIEWCLRKPGAKPPQQAPPDRAD